MELFMSLHVGFLSNVFKRLFTEPLVEPFENGSSVDPWQRQQQSSKAFQLKEPNHQQDYALSRKGFHKVP